MITPSRILNGSLGSRRDRIKDLSDSLKPLNWTTKALGLVRLPSSPADRVFGWANVIVLAVTLAISFVYLPTFIRQHLKVRDYSIMSLVNCAWWSSIHVMGLVNMLVPATKKQHLANIVACLSRRPPGESEDSLDEERHLRSACRWSWFFAILAIATYALLIYNELFCDDNPFNELESVHFIAVDFFIVAALVTESQLILVLYIAHYRFATLNKNLALALRINSTVLEKSRAERLGVFAPQLPPIYSENHESGRKRRQQQYDSTSVIELAEAHSRLSQVADHVNKAYGVQILVSSAFRLFNLTIGLYYTLVLFIGHEKVETFWLVILQTAIWIALYEISILAIVLMSEAVSGQANLARMLVCEALIIVKNNRIRRKLHLFSLQLHHSDVRFAGCKFFDLNLLFLTSMTSSVVNYLIILVQFQLASIQKS